MHQHPAMCWGLPTRLSANKHTVLQFMLKLKMLNTVKLFNFETHIWSKEELNAVKGSFQSQSSNQEDRKNQIRQRRCHINRL